MTQLRSLIFLSAFALGLSCRGAAADFLDDAHTWGYQVMADRADWKSDPDFLHSDHWSDMALVDGRFPLVVYLDRRDTQPCLRSIEWKDGNKLDTVMLPVTGYVALVRVEVSGSQVAVAWQEQSSWYDDSGSVKWSRRTAAGWSQPETVFSGKQPQWDFKLDSAGNPHFACAIRPVAPVLNSQVFVMNRSADGWTTDPVKESADWAISQVRMIYLQDQPQLVWKETDPYYVTTETHLFHAYKAGGNWVQGSIAGSVIGAFFTGPQGMPAVLASSSYTATPLLSFFNGSSWSAGQAGPDTNGPALSATTAADGTIYATGSNSLGVLKAGVPARVDAPQCHAVSVEPDGMIHLLGDSGGLLRCSTRVAADWSEEALTTYEEGAILDGLALDPQDDPKVFGYVDTADRIFSKASGSWVRTPSGLGSFGWSIALSHAGQIRAMSDFGYYSYGKPGSLELEHIPVTISSFSSSTSNSMALDAQDNPHGTLLQDNSSTGTTNLLYATKKGTAWSVETITGINGNTAQSDIALGPDGTPWVMTQKGIYHRTASGWKQDYATPGQTATCCGIRVGSDASIYAVYLENSRLYALAGKAGVYQRDLLDFYQGYGSPLPSMALAHDRPVVCFPVLQDYTSDRNVPVFAERTGNFWRQHYMAPPSAGQRYGKHRKIAVDSRGNLLVAEEKTLLRDHSYADIIVLRRSSVPAPDPARLGLGQSTTAGGGHRFSLDLQAAPLWQTLELQTSTDLKNWNRVVRIGPDLATPAAVSGLTVRGDGFRTAVTLDAAAGEPARFVRLAPGN